MKGDQKSLPSTRTDKQSKKQSVFLGERIINAILLRTYLKICGRKYLSLGQKVGMITSESILTSSRKQGGYAK